MNMGITLPYLLTCGFRYSLRCCPTAVRIVARVPKPEDKRGLMERSLTRMEVIQQTLDYTNSEVIRRLCFKTRITNSLTSATAAQLSSRY